MKKGKYQDNLAERKKNKFQKIAKKKNHVTTFCRNGWPLFETNGCLKLLRIDWRQWILERQILNFPIFPVFIPKNLTNSRRENSDLLAVETTVKLRTRKTVSYCSAILSGFCSKSFSPKRFSPELLEWETACEKVPSTHKIKLWWIAGSYKVTKYIF